MIIEKRTYVLHPGRLPEYLKLYEEEGFAIQEPVLGNLIGYFVTEVGTQNEVMHMWGYEDFADRERRRAELMSIPEWQMYLAKILPMILTMENAVLRGAPFSPIP